jgi:hypothetical protein
MQTDGKQINKPECKNNMQTDGKFFTQNNAKSLLE